MLGDRGNARDRFLRMKCPLSPIQWRTSSGRLPDAGGAQPKRGPARACRLLLVRTRICRAARRHSLVHARLISCRRASAPRPLISLTSRIRLTGRALSCRGRRLVLRLAGILARCLPDRVLLVRRLRLLSVVGILLVRRMTCRGLSNGGLIDGRGLGPS